jgi:hypothetical protein
VLLDTHRCHGWRCPERSWLLLLSIHRFLPLQNGVVLKEGDFLGSTS